MSEEEHPGEDDGQQVVTRLLHAWSGGDAQAADQLAELVYAQVRAIAGKHLRQFGSRMTLQPTELANELFMRLIDAEVSWQDRRHFYAVVSVAMRRILVDAVRLRGSERRGGANVHVTLSAADEAPGETEGDAFAVEEALAALRQTDPRKCEVVELNYLLGLSREEISEVVGISVSTVDRELRFARAWLKQRLAA